MAKHPSLIIKFGESILFHYTNHAGKWAERHAIPLNLFFGITDHHSKPQWFLHSYDIDRKAYRDFALADIQID